MSAGIHYYEMCVVCFEADPSYLFKPCRHRCVCKDCAHKYADGERFTTCPVCRKDFDAIEFDANKPPKLTKNSKSRRNMNQRVPKSIPPMRNDKEPVAASISASMNTNSAAQNSIIDSITNSIIDQRLRPHYKILHDHVQWLRDDTDEVKKDLEKLLSKGVVLAPEKLEILLLQRMENECLKRREILRKKSVITETSGNIGSPVQPLSVPPTQGIQSRTPIAPLMQNNRNLDWCSPPNAKTPITPLPLMQPRFIPPPMGSPFGPTILLNEIINADFLVHHKLREQPVIYGYLSLDFAPDAAKMLINSRTPVGDFIFRLKNTKNVKKLHPMQKNQLNVRNHPSGGKFLKKDESLIIKIPDMVSALQKMRVDDPEAPLLRLPVLKYDVDSLKGISSCPLSLDVNWVLKDPIQVTIGYKCNPDVVHTKLENIEISVEMDDPFDNYNAKPKANRPGKENLIVWKFPLLKPGHFGELKAYFESDDSNLDPGKVKASFDCLSANISGLEIEVPPFSQFPVKALVKKFKAGDYFSDDYCDD